MTSSVESPVEIVRRLTHQPILLFVLQGWVPMIVHHVLSLLAWPLGLVHPACHTFLLLCISMEASSPFVQLRWFLSQHVGKQSCLYKLNGLIMMLIFFGK